MSERLDRVMVVLSSSIEVVSPFSGVRCAFLHVELFEGDELLGEQILGDVVTLNTPDLGGGFEARIHLVVRRATFHSVELRTDPPIRIEQAIAPELIPLVALRSKGGDLSYRERPIVIGERVRLRAVVERSDAPASGSKTMKMVVRDDLGPCRIDEVFS